MLSRHYELSIHESRHSKLGIHELGIRALGIMLLSRFKDIGIIKTEFVTKFLSASQASRIIINKIKIKYGQSDILTIFQYRPFQNLLTFSLRSVTWL